MISLSPASCASLAQFIRQRTGGMGDADYGHLTIASSPSILALVAEWQQQERRKRVRPIHQVYTAPTQKRNS